MSSWQDKVKAIAPTLGGLLTAFGGPAGALAGAGLTAVANALGVSNNEDAVSAALEVGITPEQRAALIQSDLQYKEALITADIRKTEIAADTEKSYIADVADARAHNANTVGILRLGYGVNALSYGCVFAILYGCYKILMGVDLHAIDPGALVAISTLLGGVVQWVMSNCGQANSFFFGSSPTARANATQMSQSVTDTAKALGKK